MLKDLAKRKEKKRKDASRVKITNIFGLCASILVLNTIFFSKKISSKYDQLSEYHGHPQPEVKLSTLDELQMLTAVTSDPSDCLPPLKFYHNRIVKYQPIEATPSDKRQIPKILHVSMRSRCLPQDTHTYMKQWEKQLPNHSIFFHDDNAVHDLIHNPKYWSNEFPWLKSAMKCVFSKGAMTIDVWRILVMYKFGGIYTDIDNWPEESFNENTIPNDVSGFFYSDHFDRLSQWFIAVEPNHPIMYFAIKIIIKNLLEYHDYIKPRLVYLTGPHPLLHAYATFMIYRNITFNEYLHHENSGNVSNLALNVTDDDIFKFQRYKGISGMVIEKKSYPRGILSAAKYYDDMVDYNGTMIKRGDRVAKESGVIHWPYQTYGNGSNIVICKIEQRKWKRYQNVSRTTIASNVIITSHRFQKK